jgi:hypothetical protein
MLSIVWLSHLFWFSHCLLQGALFWQLMRRHYYRQYPYFAVYTLAATLKSGLLIAMNYAPFITGRQYMQGFLFGDALITALTFGVIYEVFRHVLRGNTALDAFGTELLRWIIVALVLVATALAWIAPGAGAGRLVSGFFLVQRSVNILQCGLLLFLLLLSRYFNLSLRSYTFGIAFGLGILAAVNLATAAIRSQIEPAGWHLANRVMNAIGEGAYLSCVLVWFAYLLFPKKDLRADVHVLPQHDLETWNQELERLLHQ